MRYGSASVCRGMTRSPDAAALAAALLLVAACSSDEDPLGVDAPLVFDPADGVDSTLVDTSATGPQPNPADGDPGRDTLPIGGGASVGEGGVAFAVIGDFGLEGPAALAVSRLVAGWDPALVITTGDNNYVYGELETFDENVGQYYCEFIYNPDAPEGYVCGGRSAADSTNRFFPSVGNHDYMAGDGIEPYLAYFTLPGNEVYYSFRRGPVAFYALDSENAGTFEAQRTWLAGQTAANADALYHVAYFHRPPNSTGRHGDRPAMQWDFEALGVDVVLSGHEHNYQRVAAPAARLYLVNGVGGAGLREDCYRQASAAREVVFCEDDFHGALFATADADSLSFAFATTAGDVLDRVAIAPR